MNPWIPDHLLKHKTAHQHRFQITPTLVKRFRAYHRQEIVWGCLHVVLEDLNLHDDHVRWAVEYAREEGDAEGEVLARALLGLTRTQRGRIAKIC